MLSKEELGENLCKYCRVDEEDRVPKNQYYMGCEGLFCDEAYEIYLDEEGTNWNIIYLNPQILWTTPFLWKLC